MKVWIATAVDTYTTTDGKARVLGVFKNKDEAKEFVRNDIEEWRDYHADEGVEVDFAKMSAHYDHDTSDGCEWNVEEVDIPESLLLDKGKEDRHVTIKLNGPAYLGAPQPPFNEKAVNESEFEHELRGKSWLMEIKDDTGYVEWESQEEENPSDAWKNEVKRAFKANGLEAGSNIYVKFGSRDTGLIHQFTIVI